MKALLEKKNYINNQQKRTPFRDCSGDHPWTQTSCLCSYQMDRGGWKTSGTPSPGRGNGSHSLQLHPQSSTEVPLPRLVGAPDWPATSERYPVVFHCCRWNTFGKWSTNKNVVPCRPGWVLRWSCSGPKGLPHYPTGKGPTPPRVAQQVYR